MTTNFDILVSGHLCIDLLPRMAHIRLDELPSPGRLFETGPLDYSTGGCVSNTGLALHRLGVNVRLMATVGDDLIGRATVDFIRSRDPRLAEFVTLLPGESGSYTVALSPQRVDRIFLHYPGPNSAFGIENIDFDMVRKARLFHLGYPPILPRLMADDGSELEAIYRKVRLTGIASSLDMSLPDPEGPGGRVNWKRLLSRTLSYIDIFVPSLEEILFMLRRSDFERWQGKSLESITRPYLSELADEILGMGVAITGFKLGEMGIYLKTGTVERINRVTCLTLDTTTWANTEFYHPAFQAEVVGTTGAGDSAYAGLLSAILKGYSPAQSIRWANAVGACNVEAPDATSGIRTWDETADRLQAGWALHTLRLPQAESIS